MKDPYNEDFYRTMEGRVVQGETAREMRGVDQEMVLQLMRTGGGERQHTKGGTASSRGQRLYRMPDSKTWPKSMFACD